MLHVESSQSLSHSSTYLGLSVFLIGPARLPRSKVSLFLYLSPSRSLSLPLPPLSLFPALRGCMMCMQTRPMPKLQNAVHCPITTGQDCLLTYDRVLLHPVLLGAHKHFRDPSDERSALQFFQLCSSKHKLATHSVCLWQVMMSLIMSCRRGA